VAFAAGLPTIPVCTLAAIAQGEHQRTGRRRILAALDARMGEVYWGAFELGSDGLVEPVGESLVCPPASVPIPAGPDWWGAGPGWLVYDRVLVGRIGGLVSGFNGQAICEAGAIATLASGDLRAGRVVAPELARPVYLRDRVTQGG
jgi:tRNA threonylcarbamoyladenosine biosynthesis protein TsaB